MPCGCGKKSSGTVHFMGQVTSDVPDPIEWGPILWKYLHSLSEKIGYSGNILIGDYDQAGYMEVLLGTLHLIIPCPECQAHAASYIQQHPIQPLRGLKGEDLRNTVRSWLFNFHNHVRTSKNQPIIVNSIDACRNLYIGGFIPKCEYTLFVQNVGYAVRQNWVRIDVWRKWYSTSEKIRLQLGNVVI